MADNFVGILAVVVFFLWDLQPMLPEVKSWREELLQDFRAQVAAGMLKSFEITQSEAIITYSSDTLSFSECGWDLPDSSAEKIRDHLRRFQEKKSLIDRIQIAGHADSQPPGGCVQLVPYRDNLQLSQLRARAVYNILLGYDCNESLQNDDDTAKAGRGKRAHGLEFFQELDNEGSVVTAGFGDKRQLSEDPKASINRRVEIIIKFKERGLGQETDL